MKTKIVVYSKFLESLDQFESRASKIVESLGEIIAVDSHLNDSNNLIIKIIHTDKPLQQRFYVLPWLDIGKNAEEIINTSISHLEDKGNIVKYVTLNSFQSKRAVATLVVIPGDINDLNESGKQIQQEDLSEASKEGEDKQDQDNNESSVPTGQNDSGTKARRAPRRRAKGNS